MTTLSVSRGEVRRPASPTARSSSTASCSACLAFPSWCPWSMRPPAAAPQRCAPRCCPAAAPLSPAAPTPPFPHHPLHPPPPPAFASHFCHAPPNSFPLPTSFCIPSLPHAPPHPPAPPGPPTFHQQEEAPRVFLQHPYGHSHHLAERRVGLVVPVQLIHHIPRLKETWGQQCWRRGGPTEPSTTFVLAQALQSTPDPIPGLIR